MMNREKLHDEVAEIIARQCSMYTENPVEKERCAGAAAQVLWLLEGYEVKQPPKQK